MSDRLLRENLIVSVQNQHLLREILRLLLHPHHPNRVLGGVMSQIGDPTMVPIQPGNTPKFQVTPTFSGPPFPLVAANVSIESSDPANFPVELDLTDDPTGATFDAPIPATAQPVGGSEDITVTWKYTNTDGSVATVTGTVTEQGITDNVTGGTFAQIA
ncbi:MAG: hypothetical protein WB608_16170 [Terracidiphilus sp.]